MCFSATANFVGSGVLGTVGVVTLTKVVELGGSRDSVLTARPMSKDGVDPFALNRFRWPTQK